MSSGRIGAAAVAALTLAACACGGSGSGSTGSGPTASHTVKITISDAGCSPASVTAPSGDFKFVVQNSGSAKVTELEVLNDHNIILGERENIVPGLGTRSR